MKYRPKRIVALVGLFWLLFFWGSPTSIYAVENEEGSEASTAKLDFATEVAPLLDRRCAGCHAGESAKAGFKIDDRETVLGYIEVPGEPENCTLWTEYLKAESATHNPATLVMPLSGPLADHELQTLETWIQQGADWPEGIRFVSAQGIPNQPVEKSEPESFLARLCAFTGYFHPATVHFPVALLIFGAAAAGLSFLTGGRAVYVAFYCLIWGTFFSFAASVMGWCYADEKGYPAWTTVPNEDSIQAAAAVFRHRWLGVVATVCAAVSLGLAIYSQRNPRTPVHHVWRIGLIITALMISIVGHQGGELVYGDIIGHAFNRLLGK
jgi:uncharacterized membrane protein